MKAYRHKFNKRSTAVWLLLFIVATSINIYGQDPEEDEIDVLLDELFFNEQQFIDDILESFNTYNFLYTNLSFNSNTFFSGRESGIDQFNIVPQLSYYSSSGFNLSVSGLFYETFTPNWDFTNVYVGYYHVIGKKKLFHYNVGYTRYFYSDGWDTFTNSLDLSIGLRNKKKTIGTKIGASYLFGTDQSFQIASRTYANAIITRNKDFVLKFRPQLGFLIAQQTIALEQLNTQGNQTTTEYIYNDIFDLLNTQLNLPIVLATKSWDIELGYNINIPSPVETESNLNNTGFINLSIG
ncbi:MAG: hypothetical protein KJN85_03780, partial [Maribacter sp.]|nr:hypothetical protein [Maribacter sp.]